MNNVTEALKFLGTRQRDRVTGFSGTITSICFDINGCIQGCVKPAVDKDGKIPDGYWIDLDRLECIGEPAMPPFPYEVTRKIVRGPAEKPGK